VSIFTGISADNIIYSPEGYVKGIQTGEYGNNKKSSFIPSVRILAKQTVFAEGVYGFLS